ncbi:MAG: hypothetical protein DMG53_23750 [Acidobacteria bacterium]|nr:MAG: hypothetical protein DMG53_23750 [Acidobacteriota bacterium]
MAMEFHCVTAFCAVVPVAMSRLKVATMAMRLTPFISSSSFLADIAVPRYWASGLGGSMLRRSFARQIWIPK